MEFVDFSRPVNQIMKQLFDSKKDVITTDSNALFDYYKFLHLFRHNFLHCLVMKSLDLKWQEEKQMGDFFDFFA